MAMKAYWCGGDLGECVDLIFAPTASKARYYSYKLRVRYMPRTIRRSSWH